MPNINVGPARRFESGGVLDIIDGATTHTVQLLDPGSTRIKPPIRAKLYHTDRAVQQVPLEGDDTLGEFAFTIKFTSHETTSVLDLVHAVTTTGLGKEYTVNASWYTGRGGTVTRKLALTGVSFDEAGEVQAGSEFDTIRLSGKFRTYDDTAT